MAVEISEAPLFHIICLGQLFWKVVSHTFKLLSVLIE